MQRRELLFIPLGVIIGVLISGLVFLITLPPRGDPILLAPTTTAIPLTVYITGAVEQPGVYQLSEGSRADDLVEMAGGFCQDADYESVNLAAKLRDGQSINIPTIREASDIANQEQNLSAQTTSPNIEFPININIATQEELEMLPGIGPAKASDIINYREIHGDFQLIDEIQNVSGIGPATFENLKEYITIEFTP